MQVFEVFVYNLNQLKFKDNKDFFDAVLKELDLEYSNIAFCFEPDFDGTICDKAIRYFPELKEYKRYFEPSTRYFKSPPEYSLSSVYAGKNGEDYSYLKHNHIDAFCALLKKVPQTINFGFMGVVLDNINWYAKETQRTIALTPSPNNVIYHSRFLNYFSNSIRFFKEYDYGNKINAVEIMIERTIESGNLGPYPYAFSEVLSKLGKPKLQYLKCSFADAEKKRWEKAEKRINEEIVANSKVMHLGVCQVDDCNKNAEDLINSVIPVTGFSPKAIFSKWAKKTKYKYVSFYNGCYKYNKQNEHNHTFTVAITNIPFSSLFEVSFSAKGYNFDHFLYTANQFTIKDISCAEKCAEKIFETALEVEQKYTELLLSMYGKTPEWYVNSQTPKSQTGR